MPALCQPCRIILYSSPARNPAGRGRRRGAQPQSHGGAIEDVWRGGAGHRLPAFEPAARSVTLFGHAGRLARPRGRHGHRHVAGSRGSTPSMEPAWSQPGPMAARGHRRLLAHRDVQRSSTESTARMAMRRVREPARAIQSLQLQPLQRDRPDREPAPPRLQSAPRYFSWAVRAPVLPSRARPRSPGRASGQRRSRAGPGGDSSAGDTAYG